MNYYEKLKAVDIETRTSWYKLQIKYLKESIIRSGFDPKGSLVRDLVLECRKDCGLPTLTPSIPAIPQPVEDLTKFSHE